MYYDKTPLHLFCGFGIELEYMIVDRGTLAVKPISDQLIAAAAGSYVSDVDQGAIAWSNELVLHLIELKTNGPAQSLLPLADLFSGQIRRINDLLARFNAMLLPTGAHPFMNPLTEMQLWPHDYNTVYEQYNKIFDCRGHGWANLQSMHLNFPFADDEEFGRLHAAIRLLLPLIPAIAASTPILDSGPTGFFDSRLAVYRANQSKIPSIGGMLIPEQVYTKHDYESVILEKIYADIAPYDPDGILQDEFLNSRGAIARFSRNTIEIRLIDIQECPMADSAIAAVITEALKHMVSGQWLSYEQQRVWPEERLANILLSTIQNGSAAQINDAAFLSAFGYDGTIPCAAGALWQHITTAVFPPAHPHYAYWHPALDIILSQGTLSERIIRALQHDFSRNNIMCIYRRLAECLQRNCLFEP